MNSAETLRQAADRIEQRAAKTGGPDWRTWLTFAYRAGHIPPGPANWIAMTGPKIAAPLAAWLRGHADYLAAAQCSADPDALSLANTILGKETA